MGLASSLFQWIPNASVNDSHIQAELITQQNWQVLAEAKRRRTPLIIHSSKELNDRGHQSLILKINPKNNTCSIDIPHPSLPSDYLSLPKHIYAVIKQPGSYRHWLIEGQLVERAQASDGPYFKLHINKMQFCDFRTHMTYMRKIYHYKECRSIRRELQTLREYVDFIMEDIDTTEVLLPPSFPSLIESNSQKCADKLVFELSRKLDMPISFISLGTSTWQKELNTIDKKRIIYLTQFHSLKRSAKENLLKLFFAKRNSIFSYRWRGYNHMFILSK